MRSSSELGGNRFSTWVTDQGYVLMVITAVAWSGNAVVARSVNEVIPPIGLAFWRWAGAAPIFILLAWPHLRREWPQLMNQWRPLLALSALGIAGYNTFVYVGLDSTTAINMVLINTSRPVLIVLLSFAVFRVRVAPLQALGLCLGLVGTTVIVRQGNLDVLAGFTVNPGDLWVLVGTVSWAIYTVYLPKRPAVNPTTFMAASVIIGLVIILPFYLWETATAEAVPLVPTTVWSVAYLAIFASGIAYLSYNRMVELLGANRAGITSYLIPVFGTTFAILFLDERLETYHIIGVALLLVGSVLASRSGRPDG